MTGGRDGFGVVEALVALALAAVAFGALAAATRTATEALRRTSARQAAVAAALGRLEALRGGPRDSGSDLLPGSPSVARAWRHVPGRGRPDLVEAEATCDGSRVTLGEALWP